MKRTVASGGHNQFPSFVLVVVKNLSRAHYNIIETILLRAHYNIKNNLIIAHYNIIMKTTVASGGKFLW